MLHSETIAAISTALAPAAIGIVRISGSMAITIAVQIFRPSNGKTSLDTVEARRLILGWIVGTDGEYIDECLAVVMRQPESYTGEDMVEFHCHGSPVVLRRVLALALTAGARAAGPGEFTRRAFVNGKLDLVQVEAVGDLLEAGSSGAAALATGQLEGSLSAKISEMRLTLRDFLVHVQAAIDYPEEVEEVAPAEWVGECQKIRAAVWELLAEAGRGMRVRNGVDAVLVGRPNVGKSSIMNVLLRQERAIVTEIAGTTRDVIEESVEIAGVAFRLSDTAGLRESVHQVEEIGVQRARKKLAEADLVLAVFDGSQPLTNEDRQFMPLLSGRLVIGVINKIDLPQVLDPGELGLAAVVKVSALSGTGREELEQAMAKAFDLQPDWQKGKAFLTRPRQEGALTGVAEALDRLLIGLEKRMTADVLAMELEAALWHLGELTGETSPEEVVDEIFRRFCVGK